MASSQPNAPFFAYLCALASLLPQLFPMTENQDIHTSLSFPKAQKLCGDKPIGHLFASGTGFTRFPLRVVYQALPKRREGEAPLRMMVSVGKKRFKRAVKRNRVKRLVREAWRLNKHVVEAALAESDEVGALHVAFVFVGKELPDMPAITECVSKAIEKLVVAVKSPQSATCMSAQPAAGETATQQ